MTDTNDKSTIMDVLDPAAEVFRRRYDEYLIAASLANAFDEFIAACMDDDGKPKAPSHKELMKARGYLPPYCKHALGKRGG